MPEKFTQSFSGNSVPSSRVVEDTPIPNRSNELSVPGKIKLVKGELQDLKSNIKILREYLKPVLNRDVPASSEPKEEFKQQPCELSDELIYIYSVIYEINREIRELQSLLEI